MFTLSLRDREEPGLVVEQRFGVGKRGDKVPGPGGVAADQSGLEGGGTAQGPSWSRFAGFHSCLDSP